MRDNALRNTINSGAKVVESIAASKDAVSDALQEGKDTVTQFLKDTRHTAEDLLEEATHNINRLGGDGLQRRSAVWRANFPQRAKLNPPGFNPRG